MLRGELVKWLEKEARTFYPGREASIHRNQHLHRDRSMFFMHPEHDAALLVCFVNHLAAAQGIDLALHADDIT